MNENHARVCPSPEWAAFIQEEVLPSLTEHAELGADMLEIGPGPGAATEWLRHRVRRLTAVELDDEAAAKLGDRFAGGNVEIVVGNAAELTYPDSSFDSVGCFTMLHHVPTVALQNKIFAEAFRVLRPGGVLVGSDSLASKDLHDFHSGDTYNPIEPAGLLGRLQTVGFDKITVMMDGIVKFVAGKPGGPGCDGCCGDTQPGAQAPADAP
jgi:ubiquinone/menaquinone biosynthesis C-methylase UbiE